MAIILVIDDEELLVDLIVQTLRLAGHYVLAVKDNSDALELIQPCTFDLLLCDVHIRRKFGFELQRRSKALENKIPILFMSGSTGLSNAMSGKSNEGKLLQKPFTAKELLAAVNKALLRKTHTQGGSL